MVSFSLTQSSMKNEYPYALFGGYNSSQIVDGSDGLKTFKNYQTRLGTWALLGQSFSYGDIIETGLDSIQYPAILDTGNSELSVPPDIFDSLAQKWMQDVPNVRCPENITFCVVNSSCESIVDRLQPVGFQMSDYIFEIMPEEYLF